MPMTLTQFLALAEPQFINKIWHESEQIVEPIYSRLANTKDMDDQLFVEDFKMAGFGALQTIDEGGPVSYDEALTPIRRRYDYTVRGLGYQITDKLVRNEKFGQVELFERDLRRAVDDDIETFVAAMYNNVTNTTISAGFDGLSLANTAHTRQDGGDTQSNRPTTLSALDLAGLQAGLIKFNKWVNDRGRPIRGNAMRMVIPPDLELTARELLESQMRPDTANNATNVVTRYGLDIVVWRYLSSTTFWALVGDNHDINFYWQFRPESKSETDFDTDVIKRKVRWAGARGHGHFINFYLGND